jgi:pimeloyl-ACP methyl ester carboxylesterase
MLEVRIGDFHGESHPPENARYNARLVLVHGLWTAAWLWRHFASFLAHRGWEVVAADLRGRPQSRPARIARVTFSDYFADLTDILSTDEPPAVVIGHDVGGLLALEAAANLPVRAAVALAPPLPGSLTEEFRRVLRRGGGVLRRALPPPDALTPDAAIDAAHLRPDSRRVARALLAGELSPARPVVPAAIVAGLRDAWIDAGALEEWAGRIGAAFLTRDAAHYGLAMRGFERQVDAIHRWLVSVLGADLLKLTGSEDLEE